jgi:carbon storage regulator
MLILKRKAGQGIDVGGQVRIVLKEIRGGHVKIGIEAPTDIRVKRSESATSIEEENLRAAGSLIPGAQDLGCLDRIANAGCADPGEGERVTGCAGRPGQGECECEVRCSGLMQDGGSECTLGVTDA